MNGVGEETVCGACGYRLCGLDGPVVRCPECGRQTPLGKDYVPPKWLRRAHRRMWVTPVLLVVLASSLAASIAIYFWSGRFLAVIVVVPPVLFLGSSLLIDFQDACRNEDGWSTTLMWFVGAGVIGVGAVATCGIVTGVSIRPVVEKAAIGRPVGWLVIGVSGVLPAWAWFRLTRRLRARINELQFAGAYELAAQLNKIEKHRAAERRSSPSSRSGDQLD